MQAIRQPWESWHLVCTSSCAGWQPGTWGSGAHHLNLDAAPDVASDTGDAEIVAINEAMEALGRFDPARSRWLSCVFSAV